MFVENAEALLNRCILQDEPAAWEEFVDIFGPKLRRGVLRALDLSHKRYCPNLVEDLMQEAYCRILERDVRSLRLCRHFDGRAVSAYLARLAERVALDYLRASGAAKRGRDVTHGFDGDESIVSSEEATPASAEDRLLAKEERGQFLARCRRAASRRSRRRDFQVMKLAFLEGMTSREIAHELGLKISPTGIDTLLHRARKRLAAQGVEVVRRQRVRVNAVSPG